MSTVNKVKYHLYKWTGILGAIGMAIAVVYFAFFRVLPDAKRTLGIKAIDGYEEATEAATEVWNGFVGCKFIVPGEDLVVKSDDGEPCGDPWRPEDEWDHAATAYRCYSVGSQILISMPGNINTQACIIAHEIGHVLGAEHATIGVMANCEDPANDKQNFLRIRDADVDSMRKKFCK